MNERPRRPSKRKTVLLLAAILVAAVLLWLLYAIYVADTLTWGDVYEALGLQSGVAQGTPQDAAAGESAPRVTFLDVGQGDCILIEADGAVALIDAGDYTAEATVLAALRKRGIDRLDYLIATHPHADHIGAMEAVVERVDVGQILFTNVPADMTPTNVTFLYLLKAIDERDIPVSIPAAGDEFALGGGTLSVLYAGPGSDLNNCSMVLMYTCGDARFLLMGDAEFEVEDALCDKYGDALACDVLKAGHHGTKKATGNNILACARPTYLVVTCGVDNEYGYPKQAVLDRAAKAGAEVLRTDISGDVVFVTDGGAPAPVTEKEAA